MQPTLTIQGSGRYYNLGTSLMGADVDGDGFKDLVIGSPYAPEGGCQRGSVAVFLAKTKRKPESEIPGCLQILDLPMLASQHFSFTQQCAFFKSCAAQALNMFGLGFLFNSNQELRFTLRPISFQCFSVASGTLLSCFLSK